MKEPTLHGPHRPIILGIAGLGLAGSFMLRALDVDERFVVAACAEPKEQPRLSFCRKYEAKGYPTFDELCADPSIEAIYIATPHRYHAEQAILAVNAGKHVVVEKPMALTIEDCNLVVNAARSVGKVVIVGHSHSFDPSIVAIADLVQSGRYGRLGMIHTFNYNDFLYRPHRSDEFDQKTGGGIVFNQVAHQIEMARRISGRPLRRLRAHLGDLTGIRDAPGHCSALLQFEGGTAASLVFSSYGLFDSDDWHFNISESGTEKVIQAGEARRRFEACLDEEVAHDMLAFGTRELSRHQPYQPHFGLLIVTCAEAEIRLSPQGIIIHDSRGAQEVSVPRERWRAGHGDVLTMLWKALRLGEVPLQDAIWGRETIAALRCIELSHLQDREVDVQLFAKDHFSGDTV